MESFNGKKKLTINLSLFTNIADSFSLTSPSNKSPRIFQNTSVVGLSIVAAMTDSSKDTNGNILSSPISRPVPIACSSSSSAKKPRVFNLEKQNNNIITDDDHQVDELSENYTCVITHFGNNLVHKRVFFDDDDDDDADADGDGDGDDEIGNYSVFFASSSPLMTVGFELWSRDFLSSCFLCNKKLHGLDIFMYRGEKAFCSAECRDKQIRSDDLKENYGSEARKQLDYLVSPCSGGPGPRPQPQPIFAGVAVACANF